MLVESIFRTAKRTPLHPAVNYNGCSVSYGDFAGLILVDNDAGGRTPADADQDFGLLKGVLEDRQKALDGFIGMR